jgi:dethiobiotin synthetase
MAGRENPAGGARWMMRVTRPGRLVVVVGTGTDVGKTHVSARRLAALRASGATVAARKPVQSFAAGDEDGATDAHVLGAATGEAPDTVCPSHRWLAVPMAPPMAADVLGVDAFTVADLAGEVVFPDGIDEGVVETVGGVRSPVASDGDSIDLLAALEPDAVVLVAHSGLGVINDVRLAVAAVASVTTASIEVVLNRFDSGQELHRRNRDWLCHHDGLHLSTYGEDVS